MNRNKFAFRTLRFLSWFYHMQNVDGQDETGKISLLQGLLKRHLIPTDKVTLFGLECQVLEDVFRFGPERIFAES